MAKIKLYRVQINLDSAEVGKPVTWFHDGTQFLGTLNRPQAGLLFEDEIKTLEKNGFKVDRLEEFEFEKAE